MNIIAPCAVAANTSHAVAVNGPFIASPKVSMGASERFNANFYLGQLIGVNLRQLLQIGVGTLGFYVRCAQNPTRHELAEFLENL